ncbi:MAG: desulfoferrodoxin family protein [Candidatus Omnitrophica bacterium]|jgi:superoxide reductase|nr:desulfoferrodoxin family protein [Candidatus Omnitrophota bacterium]
MGLNDYVKTKASEGNEKHVPFINVTACSTCGEMSVVVKIGEKVFHPSTKEHYIENIVLYGLTNDEKIVFVTRFELGKENTIPYVKTHIKKGVFKKIFAVSLCNVHGLWENSIDVS